MKLNTLLRDDFFLELREGGPAICTHLFCGSQTIPGAQCPNCHLPLYRYLDLDSADPALGLHHRLPRFVPLLFCWRCRLAQEPFYYRIRSLSVELIRFGRGREDDNEFPYPDYPPYFPAALATLRPLTQFEADALKALNAGANSYAEPLRSLSRPQHQIGGVPILIQGDYHRYYPQAATCPDCAKPMPFLASFGDRCLDSRGFAGNDFVQTIFSICPIHHVVSAHQACD